MTNKPEKPLRLAGVIEAQQIYESFQNAAIYSENKRLMTELEKPVLAWHFCGDTLRDGQPIPRKGVWLKHEGPVKMCESGLHASRRLIDALKYAPGNTLCWVECLDIVAEQDDKLVCRQRRIVAKMDAEKLLRRAARKFALDVVHLWTAPDVVIKYLKVGDESLRDAAWTTAGNAARAAAGDAARTAAGAAARTAARTAQNKWLEQQASDYRAWRY